MLLIDTISDKSVLCKGSQGLNRSTLHFSNFFSFITLQFRLVNSKIIRALCSPYQLQLTARKRENKSKGRKKRRFQKFLVITTL